MLQEALNAATLSITEFHGYVFGYTYTLQEALNAATLPITEFYSTATCSATSTRSRRR